MNMTVKDVDIIKFWLQNRMMCAVVCTVLCIPGHLQPVLLIRIHEKFAIIYIDIRYVVFRNVSRREW